MITYNSADVDINLGEDFLIEDWDADDAEEITFKMTYYPNSTDHTKNPVSKKVSIPKPKTDTDLIKNSKSKKPKK